MTERELERRAQRPLAVLRHVEARLIRGDPVRSTRVRRNSSGLHRWVFAVTKSSGARRRIPAIFSRFRPSVRSAPARVGWWPSVFPSDPAFDPVGVQ